MSTSTIGRTGRLTCCARGVISPRIGKALDKPLSGARSVADKAAARTRREEVEHRRSGQRVGGPAHIQAKTSETLNWSLGLGISARC
jgi:hypothetical protein